MGLTPRKHLGKTLQDVRETLHRLNSEFGAHICGEGGEFETFTTDCPLYKSRIIVSSAPPLFIFSAPCPQRCPGVQML
jgi:diphthine-ammonia ligase